MPKISVLMPTYNCAEFIVGAARSILNQSIRDVELLILDDGSTDGTLERLRESIIDERMIIVEGKTNRGLPARLNQLLDLSSGRFIARMDGDDVSYPERIARQLDYLDSNPDVDLVACAMSVIDNDNILIGKNRVRGLDHSEIARRPWRGFHMNHGTWLARRSFFERNRYDATAMFVEDEELLLRSLSDAKFAMIPEVHYAYRVGGLSALKIARTRFNYVRMIWRAGIRERRPGFLLSGPDQALKAIIDAAVIGLGLERRFLAHRFGVLTASEQSQWAIALDRIGGAAN